MKILIGIDDSPHSQAALAFVRKLSWPANTQAIVVSAVPMGVYAFTEVYVPVGATNEALMEEMKKVHQDVVSRAEADLRAADLKTEGRALTGDAREIIVQLAKDEGVDLVIVGSHGRSGITKLVMGSVASHVVTHSPCSVLVVKKPS